MLKPRRRRKWFFDRVFTDGEASPATAISELSALAMNASSYELTVARVVCRAYGVDALDHVVLSISAMLDTTQAWTLEDAAAKGFKTLVERILRAAVGNGSAKELKHQTAITRALHGAAANGHVDVVQLLLTWHPTCAVASVMEDAAANGHLSVVQYLHENAATAQTQRMTLDAMDSAAVNGHLDVLQWLHTHRAEGCTTRAMDGAARAGRLEIVQWLHAHRKEGCTTQAMDGAAANGHLAVLAWLYWNRREGCSSLAASAAAQKGHTHITEWLERMQRENDKPLVTWHEKLLWRAPGRSE